MPDLPEDPTALPLRQAYLFLESHGLSQQAAVIRTSQDRLGSYTSTLKRAKMVGLLDEHGLLEQFIREYWPNGGTEQGKRLLRSYRAILQRFLSGEETEGAGDDLEEDTAFALESHLRDYLANNLSVIEAGLTIWPLEDGSKAVEFPVDASGRRIDILGRDGRGIPVVIELKVSKGHERTIGQALYYRSRVKQMFDAPTARIVIIAHEISPELRLASLEIQDAELFEYRLSMSLDKVTP